jgi:hypothetical protein
MKYLYKIKNFLLNKEIKLKLFSVLGSKMGYMYKIKDFLLNKETTVKLFSVLKSKIEYTHKIKNLLLSEKFRVKIYIVVISWEIYIIKYYFYIQIILHIFFRFLVIYLSYFPDSIIVTMGENFLIFIDRVLSKEDVSEMHQFGIGGDSLKTIYRHIKSYFFKENKIAEASYPKINNVSKVDSVTRKESILNNDNTQSLDNKQLKKEKFEIIIKEDNKRLQDFRITSHNLDFSNLFKNIFYGYNIFEFNLSNISNFLYLQRENLYTFVLRPEWKETVARAVEQGDNSPFLKELADPSILYCKNLLGANYGGLYNELLVFKDSLNSFDLGRKVLENRELMAFLEKKNIVHMNFMIVDITKKDYGCYLLTSSQKVEDAEGKACETSAVFIEGEKILKHLNKKNNPGTQYIRPTANLTGSTNDLSVVEYMFNDKFLIFFKDIGFYMRIKHPIKDNLYVDLDLFKIKFFIDFSSNRSNVCDFDCKKLKKK